MKNPELTIKGSTKMWREIAVMLDKVAGYKQNDKARAESFSSMIWSGVHEAERGVTVDLDRGDTQVDAAARPGTEDGGR